MTAEIAVDLWETRRQVEASTGNWERTAIEPALYRQILYRRLRNDLLTDVAQVALSLSVAWLLAGWLLRPVGQLTRAVDSLSQQRFPDPVAVPPGRDELARLARSFNRMTVNLKAAFDRERTFTRYASHELRTPLSAIRLQVESLQLGVARPAEVASALERNTNRIQRVLEALLHLSRASQQTAEPADAWALVNEALRSLREEQRLRVEVVNRLPGPTSVLDPLLVGQSVLNLLDNALKYSSGQVQLRVEGGAGEVRISVRDRGPGVPPELVGKLTNTFFRLGSSNDGQGLGLAFVSHVVHTLGGELELSNVPMGFEAAMVLPRASSGRETTHERHSRRRASAGKAGG
ncbi:MAG: ATP-binding protein [Trueperaceae bacterium]